VSDELHHDRRRSLSIVAMAIAVVVLVLIGLAEFSGQCAIDPDGVTGVDIP
jgi:hypothetical protein